MKLNRFKIFFSIFFIEFLSLFVFFFPYFNFFIFFVLILSALVLSLKNIKYGLYLILIEMIIGSFGYLFSLEFNGFKISIRIALFIIVFLVWFFKKLKKFLKSKDFSFFSSFLSLDFKYFYLLFILLGLGVLRSLYFHVSFKNIFFDFNAWIFFILIFPFVDILKRKENINDLMKIIGASLFWVSFETIFLLFLFSHNFSFLPELYKWIRDTRVGEITRFNSGFVRIFFQSHIYFLPAFFFVFYQTFLKMKNKEYSFLKTILSNYFISSVLFLSIIILAYSRSNWLGFLFGLFLFFLYLFFDKEKFKDIFKLFSLFIFSGIFSLIFISLLINFPFFGSKNNLNTLSLVGERASQLSSEAGVSSRWNLLPVLWKEIKSSPILGYGFAKEIAYISNDPRVRESNPEGLYKTYAFEWGWLDVWLKIGIFGLMTYLILLFHIDLKIFKLIRGGDENKVFFLSLFLGLNMIILIHFFSPYLNHPLGIAYLLLLFALIN